MRELDSFPPSWMPGTWMDTFISPCILAPIPGGRHECYFNSQHRRQNLFLVNPPSLEVTHLLSGLSFCKPWSWSQVHRVPYFPDRTDQFGLRGCWGTSLGFSHSVHCALLGGELIWQPEATMLTQLWVKFLLRIRNTGIVQRASRLWANHTQPSLNAVYLAKLCLRWPLHGLECRSCTWPKWDPFVEACYGGGVREAMVTLTPALLRSTCTCDRQTIERFREVRHL